MNAFVLSVMMLGADPTGVCPSGSDGIPLNLDFETGTLKHWTADGEAFSGQPIQGDTVAIRRKNMKSNHHGEYWIGGYEKLGDKSTGTLTSDAFNVTHPWATFLIGGGSGHETRVEIVQDGKVIFTAHGADNENMSLVAIDLAKHVGKPIQIRLVDQATGGWGHINFDDFRFHAKEPKGIAKQATPLTADEQKNAGLSPEKAAAAMTVPEGFHVTLFAGEPDVHQPVAFCFDDRGRLWVVEAFTYPKRHPHPGPVIPDKTKGDKILIFEDADGDGKFDKRIVFMEGLNLVSGIEYGFGGIYVGAAPYLLHIPVKDDKPAGEPVILLDGWGYEDTHETLNSFVWGPDGWLYGCHGVFTYSNVGKPGTPPKDRVKINAGVWRYHPTRHVFERFAEGTSNPWGLDYNQYGDFFVEACVIPHCFHIVQGGRYHRQAGEHYNPHTYIDIPTIADHLHYLGATPHGGNNKSDSAGGGHAHCGLMCYQGGAWPKEYHGQLFMGNIHGRRINMDTLHPKGSTYVAKHGKDFLLANDAWARFIAMKYGPDGNMFVIDWYDAQACHRKEPEVWDRTNGRIYKVSYRGTKPVKDLDLAKCTDEELVKYQTHENEWYAQRARRIFQERRAIQNETAKSSLMPRLEEQARSASSFTRLRALWTMNSLGGMTENNALFGKFINDADPHVTGWGLRLFSEQDLKLFSGSRASDDPVLRRDRLSVLLTLPIGNDWQVYERLLTAPGGANDSVLLSLSWFMLDRLLEHDADRGLQLALKSAIPQLVPLSVRRIASTGAPEALDLIIRQMKSVTSDELKLEILHAMQESLRGRRNLTAPSDWNELQAKLMASTNAQLKASAIAVSVMFRDPVAMDTLRSMLTAAGVDGSLKQMAFTSLVEMRDAKLGALLPVVLKDPLLRSQAIRAIPLLGSVESLQDLLRLYAELTPKEKKDALAALASKPAFAMALLDAIEAKTIPATDVPAETIRLLRAFKDEKLNARVIAVWGTVRDTPADRKKLISQWRSKLTLSHDPDLAHGRAVFAKVCAQCHTLYGVGAAIGPDITGSNRADLNYLIENMFDPSAIIAKEYAATTFDLADGRKLTGIVKAETATQLTVATATETLKINVADIDKRSNSEQSMMPDDLTKQLTEKEVKNLIAYLRHPNQVPMKATAENVKDFFNGKDLTGWDGEKTIWSVDNGEIVGKSEKGLKANQFLTSNLEVTDFKLSFKVKLVPAKENSGVQFRSVRIPGTEMRGPQADIGQGWWGKLYEESGRGLLVKEGGEQHVKKEEWNDYTVDAKGATVKIWINEKLCCDYTDEKLAKKGLIGLQTHSGGPIEVRFKDLKLEVLP